MAKFATAKLGNGEIRHINLDNIQYVRPNKDGSSTIFFSKEQTLKIETSFAELMK